MTDTTESDPSRMSFQRDRGGNSPPGRNEGAVHAEARLASARAAMVEFKGQPAVRAPLQHQKGRRAADRLALF